MNPNSIICPKCNAEISIDEVLRKQSEERIRSDIQEEERQKFDTEKSEALRKQKEEDFQQTKLLQDRVREMEEKNRKFQQEQMDLLKSNQRLEDEKRDRDLEEAKKISEERKRAWDEATLKASEENRLTNAEKDKKLADVLLINEELKRKVEQGSQQTQGEVLELELEELLKKEFPNDDIKPVPKGMRGADVIQVIYGASGDIVGKIIWESKRAKEFGKDWIGTLKTNSIEAGADVAILVTTIMPEEIKYFGPKQGVYITSVNCIKEVAKLLRGTLLKVYKVREENLGKDEKKAILWTYLTGSQFAQKFAAVIENHIEEREDLDKEKRVAIKNWSAREKRAERTINTLAMIYGDLQGLLGSSLPQIKALEMESLEIVETTQISIEESTIKVGTKTVSEINDPS